ncbi:MAG: leucine-rich repeat protein [Lachnospiraceae bacterium]|nr:leucine-rich repeat protein [Lachnospiraceae bacterium]
MVTGVDYIRRGEQALICRLYGDGTLVRIPDQVDGLPVTGLADHCFAAETSWKLRKEEHILSGDCKPERVLSTQAEEIILPDGLEAIGEYAFYGCRDLHSLELPWDIHSLSGGIFVAVNNLRELRFRQKAGQEDRKPCETEAVPAYTMDEVPGALRELLLEITDELDICLVRPDGSIYGKMVFPGYVEEGIENTPARIIDLHFEGMGYKYRQCFVQRQIDWNHYDQLFYETSVQELPETVRALCFARLMYPEKLGEKAKQDYLEYLKRDPAETARWIFRGTDLAPLKLLMQEEDYFTQPVLESFLQTALERKEREAVSLLMDYQRRRFPVKKKSYDL